MMNTIEKNPALAAAFYFIFTWACFPIAALVISQVRGITFAAAAAIPYVFVTFLLGSVIAAFRIYMETKNYDWL